MKVLSSSRMAIDDIDPSAREEILDRFGTMEAYCTQELIAEREHMMDVFRKMDILQPCDIICISCSINDQAGPKTYRRYPCLEAVLEELCHGEYTLGLGVSNLNSITNPVLMMYTRDMFYYFMTILTGIEKEKYHELQGFKYTPTYLEALMEDREVVQYVKYRQNNKKNWKKDIKYVVKKPTPRHKGWSKHGAGTQRHPRKEPVETKYYVYNPEGRSMPVGKRRRSDVQNVQKGTEGRNDG